MHDIIILNDNHQLFEAMKEELPYYTDEVNAPNGLDRTVLRKIARNSGTEYFYVITNSSIVFSDSYKFDYRPDEFSKDLMHVWGKGNYLRLFRAASVLKNIDSYTDEALCSGNVKLKHVEEEIFRHRPYDVVFLSYSEYNIADKWEAFRKICPNAIHITGVKGIMEAHRQAAQTVRTSMFYVVDADANVCPDFKFDYTPAAGQENYVHVWRSYNHSINISYGYGGIKLFPTILIRNVKTWNLDFTTSVKTGFVAMSDVSNETVINESAYSAWKAAFRECVKLASSMMPNDTRSLDRLRAWLNPNDRARFSEWVRKGAVSGTKYGSTYIDNQSMLKKINDYEWLAFMFSQVAQPDKVYLDYFWKFKTYADFS